MKILHTEASPGWGGQEIRILREAEGMRDRGHEVIMAIQEGGGLVKAARDAGFLVYEISFAKPKAFSCIWNLRKIVKAHGIELINTHSPWDAWFAGFLGFLMRVKVVRTRHVSTPIKKGLNSVALYRWFADSVVTTCEEVAVRIRDQASIGEEICKSIPTGVNPSKVKVSDDEALAFRKSLGLNDQDLVIGTTCVLRSWKGISDFLQAAELLKEEPNLKWLVVGGGVSEHYFREEWKQRGLENNVIFTGHLDNPFPAISAMDVFALLSTGNEGVSQASLQAAYLEKPLITTRVGGLHEVCIDGKTGFNVDSFAPKQVAEKVLAYKSDKVLRKTFGESAKRLVEEQFTIDRTIDEMEKTYRSLFTSALAK